MKKKFSFVLAAVLLLTVLSACGKTDGPTAAVQNVGDIVSEGSLGYVSRYAGIVVSGASADVKKDADKTILQVNVKEGDTVQEGDVLFSYDTEVMRLKLEKLELEYEELQNKIESANKEIPELEKKLKRANATDQLGYKLQIQSLQADVLESDYNMSLKEREIAAMKTAMDNADVFAPISGRVMSVKEDENSQDPNQQSQGDGSGSDAFITITDVETFRVKGTINEMNAGTLQEGTPVIIRSRVNEKTVWNGVLESIDWEHTVTSNNDGYYMSGDEMTTSTKYPFYIALEDFEGLLLGQHVFIEPDYGQNAQKEGIWLPAYFLVYNEDGSAFVWAQSGRGKLEKRSVTLGETDEEAGTVLIAAGLTEDDMIAFPEDSLTVGMVCVDYADSMFSEESSSEAVFMGGVG